MHVKRTWTKHVIKMCLDSKKLEGPSIVVLNEVISRHMWQPSTKLGYEYVMNSLEHWCYAYAVCLCHNLCSLDTSSMHIRVLQVIACHVKHATANTLDLDSKRGASVVVILHRTMFDGCTTRSWATATTTTTASTASKCSGTYWSWDGALSKEVAFTCVKEGCKKGV